MLWQVRSGYFILCQVRPCYMRLGHVWAFYALVVQVRSDSESLEHVRPSEDRLGHFMTA
jgi:hypothetical protein